MVRAKKNSRCSLSAALNLHIQHTNNLHALHNSSYIYTNISTYHSSHRCQHARDQTRRRHAAFAAQFARRLFRRHRGRCDRHRWYASWPEPPTTSAASTWRSAIGIVLVVRIHIVDVVFGRRHRRSGRPASSSSAAPSESSSHFRRNDDDDDDAATADRYRLYKCDAEPDGHTSLCTTASHDRRATSTYTTERSHIVRVWFFLMLADRHIA